MRGQLGKGKEKGNPESYVQPSKGEGTLDGGVEGVSVGWRGGWGGRSGLFVMNGGG